jgi:hypothetical protein
MQRKDEKRSKERIKGMRIQPAMLSNGVGMALSRGNT